MNWLRPKQTALGAVIEELNNAGLFACKGDENYRIIVRFEPVSWDKIPSDEIEQWEASSRDNTRKYIAAVQQEL